ncbi:hypothetical protein, partial [Luteibacter jiangsuensis]|uniref:hypothetical protein n=1 Tax=Luteibacter jiangsuensis TaxID=637577 RepID=UPI0019645F90
WPHPAVAIRCSPPRTTGQQRSNLQPRTFTVIIGTAGGGRSQYRNTAHHTPKSKEQAAKKYRDCRHGFLEGLRKIPLFRNAMRNLGLSGGLDPI